MTLDKPVDPAALRALVEERLGTSPGSLADPTERERMLLALASRNVVELAERATRKDATPALRELVWGLYGALLFPRPNDPASVWRTLIEQPRRDGPDPGVEGDAVRILLEAQALAISNATQEVAREVRRTLDRVFAAAGIPRRPEQPAVTVLEWKGSNEAPWTPGQTLFAPTRPVQVSPDHRPLSDLAFTPAWLTRAWLVEESNAEGQASGQGSAPETRAFAIVGSEKVTNPDHLLPLTVEVVGGAQAKPDPVERDAFVDRLLVATWELLSPGSQETASAQGARRLCATLALESSPFPPLWLEPGPGSGTKIAPGAWIRLELKSEQSGAGPHPPDASPSSGPWSLRVRDGPTGDWKLRGGSIPALQFSGDSKGPLEPGPASVRGAWTFPEGKTQGARANGVPAKTDFRCGDLELSSRWASAGGAAAEDDDRFFPRAAHELRVRGRPVSALDWEEALRRLDLRGRVHFVTTRPGPILEASGRTWARGVQLAFVPHVAPRPGKDMTQQVAADVSRELSASGRALRALVRDRLLALAPLGVPVELYPARPIPIRLRLTRLVPARARELLETAFDLQEDATWERLGRTFRRDPRWPQPALNVLLESVIWQAWDVLTAARRDGLVFELELSELAADADPTEGWWEWLETTEATDWVVPVVRVEHAGAS